MPRKAPNIPAAGPQNPGKYPFTGAMYAQYGDVPGYVYNPWDDQYYMDQGAYQEYLYNSGQAQRPAEPPKPPSMWEQLGPAAGAALAGEAAKGIGQAIPGFFGLGGSSSAPAAAATVAPVVEATQTTGSGLFGLGNLFGGGSTSAAAPAAAASTAAPIATAPGGLPVAAGYEAVAGGAPQATGTGLLGGFSGMGGLAGVAVPAAVAGGVALGAKGLYDTIKGDDTKGALDWASRGTIGIATGGLSEVFRAANGLFGSKDTWKKEKNQLESLQEDGVYIPENLFESMPTGPRSKEDLINKTVGRDFVGFAPDGTWVNNVFADSRDEKDLRGYDIVNYSAFAKNDPEWFRKPMEERVAFAEQALASGAVDEHNGTIDVDFNKLNNASTAPQQEAPAPTPAPSQPAPQVPTPMVPKVAAGSLPQLAQQKPAPKPQPGRTGLLSGIA